MLQKIIDTRKASDVSVYRSVSTTFDYSKGSDISESLIWTSSAPGTGVINIDTNGDAKPEPLNTYIDASRSWVIVDANGDYLPDMYNYSAYTSYIGWQYS